MQCTCFSCRGKRSAFLFQDRKGFFEGASASGTNKDAYSIFERLEEHGIVFVFVLCLEIFLDWMKCFVSAHVCCLGNRAGIGKLETSESISLLRSLILAENLFRTDRDLCMMLQSDCRSNPQKELDSASILPVDCIAGTDRSRERESQGHGGNQ